MVKPANLTLEDNDSCDDLFSQKMSELLIKISLKKYTLNESYAAFMQRGIFGNGFVILTIEPKHTTVLTTLPFHHRDPFDRLLCGDQGQKAVLLSFEEFNAWQETLYLLSNPANAEHLRCLSPKRRSEKPWREH